MWPGVEETNDRVAILVIMDEYNDKLKVLMDVLIGYELILVDQLEVSFSKVF